MTITFNSSDADAGIVDSLFCVNDAGNAVIDLCGVRTCTPHANVTFQTGTWGRSFRTKLNGNNSEGVAFTPGFLTKPLTGARAGQGAVIVFANVINSRASRGTVLNAASITPTPSFSPGIYTGDCAGIASGSGNPASLGTTDIINAAPHSFGAGSNGTNGKVWVDGTAESSPSTGTGNASDTGLATYIGGNPSGGFGGLDMEVVWVILCKTMPSDATVARWRASVGASNTFALATTGAATAPGAPTIGTATAAVTGATVAFTAPASDGGSAITGYIATASTGETASGATSPITFATGTLTAGVARTFHVQAINAINTGTASAESNSITPFAPNPVPTFSGTIANITGTGGTAITPVDVSSLFSDTGDTKTFSASPAGTAWPAGLVIDPATGIISGTVATSTTTAIKVRDTDSVGQSVDSNAFNVTISAPASTVTGVTVTPSTATVNGGATQAFSAAVAGASSPSQTVNWSCAAGSITVAGVWTAPATTSSAQTITITATSAQDGTKSGNATVTVPAAAGVTFTATLPMEYAVGGGLRLNQAMRVSVLHPTTDVPIVTLPSPINTHATTGVPPPFTVTGPVAGNVYPVKFTNPANALDFAVCNMMAT